MISDFSGIVFEYAFTFNKPVIMMNKQLNLEQYDASDLSQKTWLQSAKNKLGASIDMDKEDIAVVIENITEKDLAGEISAVADKYWSEQGKCVKNIVNYIENSIKGN
jgi:CDP-glycerol glycerophosphotransferase (TagB/SpsB family)